MTTASCIQTPSGDCRSLLVCRCTECLVSTEEDFFSASGAPKEETLDTICNLEFSNFIFLYTLQHPHIRHLGKSFWGTPRSSTLRKVPLYTAGCNAESFRGPRLRLTRCVIQFCYFSKSTCSPCCCVAVAVRTDYIIHAIFSLSICAWPVHMPSTIRRGQSTETDVVPDALCLLI
jgi:hypothetical protein